MSVAAFATGAEGGAGGFNNVVTVIVFELALVPPELYALTL